MRFTATLLLLAALILAPVMPARAYTLQFLDTSASRSLKWATTNITVTLSSSLSSPPSNIKAGSDVIGAARRALRRWEEASNIRFNIVVSTNDSGLVSQDGLNLITVSQGNASLFNSVDQTGRARVFFDNNGTIFEGDVAVNPATPFSTDGTNDTYDLETTFTHEIGHMLGLDHSGLVSSVMQPRQGRNGFFNLPALRRRTLTEDDRAGIRALYGPLTGLGSIAGTVTGPAGAIYGAHVVAEDTTTGRAFASNITLQSGAYRIDALPPASYRLVVEPLNEPVNAAQIATGSNSPYTGLQSTAPSFRTIEAGTVTVTGGQTASGNIALPNALTAVMNPRLLGTNFQLSSVPVPVVPNTTVNIQVAGDNLGTNPAVSVTSPYLRVDQASVQSLPGFGIPVIGFNVTVSAVAPPGEYDIRLTNGDEIAYVTGGLVISLPNGTTATSPNPIDNPSFFVAQHYRDFLNREPDQSGLDFWTNQTTNCGNPDPLVCRINVSAAFFLSIEFQQTGYLVYRIHKVAFGNLPNKPVPITFQDFLPETQQISRGVVIGQPGADQQLEANKQAFTTQFVNRADFLARYPTTLTPQQFVDTLNANAGGVLSQSERDNLVAGLSNGSLTRAQVLRQIAENQTLTQREFNPAFVLMEYFGYLRRNPDDPPDVDFSGYNFWLNKLNQFGGNFINAEMVKAFITSGEYRARFGQP